jgi:uncharacterized protein (TIGR00269 family)
MFRPNDRITIALSGGKDSTSLLHILSQLEKRFPNSELNAVTIDEGISGYMSESIRIAKKNCDNLGIKYTVISFKELYGYTLDQIVDMSKDKVDLTACSQCGILRRKALNITAKESNATKLVTAHNLDDEVQSMIMNIIRGDVFRISQVAPILEGGEKEFIPKVKPLCEVPENEVALYAFFKQIDFQKIACPYMESSLRQDVRLFLNRLETKHSGTKYTVYRSFEKLYPCFIELKNKIDFKSCIICGEPTTSQVCRSCQIIEDLRLNLK